MGADGGKKAGQRKKEGDLTPLMRQYLAVKERYPDALLLFRMGDFYETFFEDARKASEALDIVLTQRDRGPDGEPAPLAGIPYRALDSYLSRLIRKGFRVAICEQVEDPKEAKGVVRREVVRVVTPGTLVDDTLLGTENNYLMAYLEEGGRAGLAFLDISTGEFYATELGEPDLASKVSTEIARFSPAEVLLISGTRWGLGAHCESSVTYRPPEDFDPEAAERALLGQFGTATLDGFGLKEMPLATRAAGAAVAYITETQRGVLRSISGLRCYHPGDNLVLDYTTLRNLELLRNIRDGSEEGTLFSVLDRTRTRMGSRLLRRWIQAPLRNVDAIRERLDAVEALSPLFVRSDLREALGAVADLERVLSRVGHGSASPRDLAALRESLRALPSIREAASAAGSSLMRRLVSDLGDWTELLALLDATLVDQPPAQARDGGVIREGADAELDRLRGIGRKGKEWIVEYEAKERERTGIRSLKVRFNRVFGYFIEVSTPNLPMVPAEYVRKQTTSNGERFITEALKEWETQIVHAEERAIALEQELFTRLRERVAEDLSGLMAMARALAQMDVLASLADAASVYGYVRPEVDDGGVIDIRDGRHPVVERMVEGFVPNDALLDDQSQRFVILTGPNMAGKSTFMRQVALIAIMAQMGSFVSARSARVGMIDRVFTRVGAFDDLVRGQSTFMVEMVELANILRNATQRSLVLLDEIGRGTSTFDGLSIAWAVTEYLLDPKLAGCKGIFATHYHHLNELEGSVPGVKNFNVAVRERGDQVVFLHKVVPGGTDRSYGIHVAQLAGLPWEVVQRAKEILARIESEEEHLARAGSARGVRRSPSIQTVLFSEIEPTDPVLESLKAVDVMRTTPMEALEILYRLQRMAGKRYDDMAGDPGSEEPAT